jgi:large subunit ribosomal protein L22
MANKEEVKTKEVKAIARYIRMSPRKIRLVADLVRKHSVADALEQLKYSPKNAALPLTKLINSAIANAAHNYSLKKEDLFIKSLTIDAGPVYKRMEPRAQGRGFLVRKRTSHINLILEAKAHKKAKSKRSIFSFRPKRIEIESPDKPDEETMEGKVSAKPDRPVAGPKSDRKIKQNLVDLKRRLFNRKSGS